MPHSSPLKSAPYPPPSPQTLRSVTVACVLNSLALGNGHLDVHVGLDVDGGDLFHGVRAAVEVDQPLVDAHLEPENMWTVRWLSSCATDIGKLYCDIWWEN